MALSQEDYMRAIVGNDDSLWKPMPSYFTPGAPLYTEEGGEILKGPRNFDAAKRLLAESGYAGQPVTCLVAQDTPVLKAWGEVTSDLLKRLGMKADLVALDSGTLFARMPQKSPPAEGGWNMFLVWGNGAANISPAQLIIRANGDGAWFGWPNSLQVETEVAAWYDAKTLDGGEGRSAPTEPGRLRPRGLWIAAPAAVAAIDAGRFSNLPKCGFLWAYLCRPLRCMDSCVGSGQTKAIVYARGK
jgi:ABC-type transport system substrate-binding protein